MPEPSRDRKPPAAQVLTATVRRISPAGLIVGLPDGREGLIRERELAWDAEARQGWRERHKPGGTLNVVLLNTEEGQRLELSLRLAQADPWLDVEERYPIGTLADGVVTDVEHYGAFVELEPGVRGLIHHSRLPSWEKRTPQDIFWPGDQVRVMVTKLYPELRRMDLSTVDLQAVRWQNLPVEVAALSTAEAAESVTSSVGATLVRLFGHPAKTILVVENDEDQLRGVTDWLRRAGQRAEGVRSSEEAIAQLDLVHPDLLLMDVGLSGLNGIEAAQRIRTDWPQVRCVLMTDWGTAEYYTDVLDGLRHNGVGLILKPLQPEDLLGVLLETPSSDNLETPTASPARVQLERDKSSPPTHQPRGLALVLGRVRKLLHADKVALFELDPDSRRITVVDQQGPLPLHLTALPGLIHSPIRDVAEDGLIVFVRGPMDLTQPRFSRLRPLANFNACLGVPVPTELHNRYALFALFSRATPITEIEIARARVDAAQIGVWLERRRFASQVASLQRVALLGQTARFLVHEISGGLSYINMSLDGVGIEPNEDGHHAIAGQDPIPIGLQISRRTLDELKRRAAMMKTTLSSFSHMARAGQEELLRLDELVGTAVKVLSGEADTCRVEIIVVSPLHRMYFTRAQATFLQQVLVNVILNAIQQIHQIRPGGRGQVLVSMAQVVRTGQTMVQVTVEDDGPGIHWRLWEQIFEMDYTTRPDGSGLGLYISRALIDAQGGRIYVAESRVLWGTTVIVELPAKL